MVVAGRGAGPPPGWANCAWEAAAAANEVAKLMMRQRARGSGRRWMIRANLTCARRKPSSVKKVTSAFGRRRRRGVRGEGTVVYVGG